MVETFLLCKNFLKKPGSKEVLAFHKIKFSNFCWMGFDLLKFKCIVKGFQWG